MIEKDIKNLCARININYKNNPKKCNEELKYIINLIKKLDIFKGKRKKLYKIVISYKKVGK